VPTLPISRCETCLSTLRAERNRFVAFAFAWPDLLFELDDAGRIVHATGALEATIGRSAAKLSGMEFSALVTPASRGTARALLAAAKRRERLDEATITLTGPSGTVVPVAFAGHGLPELGGHVFIGLRHEPAARRAQGTESRDAATGLLDSKAFVDGVCRQLQELPSADDQAPQLSLIRLSGVEELHGDPAAVEPLLRAVGGTLRALSSSGDLAMRVGADRFGLLHGPDVNLSDVRKELLKVLPKTAEGSPPVGIEAATVPIIVGELRSEEIAKGIVGIINRFRAQQGSLAAIARSPAAFPELAKQAVRTIDQLQRIIAADGFKIVFQPIVHALLGSIHHYEALVRFPKAAGLQSTFECVSLAEEVGLVEELDLAVARKVVRWMNGAKASAGLACAINVSGTSVMSETYTEKLESLLRDNPALHSRLLFEITESSQIRNLTAANQFIRRLRELGNLVCLDDFGAGAANFPYVAALDVDVVKFDGPAVVSARHSIKGTTFLKALAGVCRELRMETVFEMVGDEASLAFARDCGADYVQGYLLGQPSADVDALRRGIPRHLFRTLETL
jgi:EAL domain-containing protein (putative c-di-GMP-specific phosphodiesterase class I)